MPKPKGRPSDKQRLDWLLNFRRIRAVDANWEKMLCEYYNEMKSPRQAIDAAMKKERA